MDCPKCGYAMSALDQTCPRCQELGSTPAPPPPPAPPPVGASPPTSPGAVEVFVPYRNPNGLAAYYIGLFAFIPVLGAVLGVVAVVLGIKGVKLARAHPERRGATHAWVGIICGGLFGLVNLLLLIGVIAAALTH